ncbi:hypothetical protein K440DRAFT_640833 [Wilcoxina mikolae CBS 423.85]|nr:hypothetical protein K440DRAFT_640833 [Wilcoxina mikolae CBS 423.85]
MTFTLVNESSSTATAIKATALCSTITVAKAGNRSTLLDQVLATASRYREVISPTIVAPDTADSAESPSAKQNNHGPCISKSSISGTGRPMRWLFPDRDFDSIQEAVEIAVKELTLQDQLKFMHGVYELFADIHEFSNVQVAWLSKFQEDNAGWRELGFKRYYDYLRTIDSSGRVREMVNRWYTSADFKKAKALLEKGCLVVNEEINLGRMGLKLYRGLVMPVAYYPFKEDQSRPRTLSASAPPPNRQIPSTLSVLIPSALPVLISSTAPTEEEKLSDFDSPTPSESHSSEDSSFEILDIPDTTPDDVTEVVNDVTQVVDDVTQVVDEDDKATSSDNESSKTTVTPTPVRTKASRKKREWDDPRPRTPPRTSQSMNTIRLSPVATIWSAMSGTPT